jgi:hypothetical protein
VHPVVDYGSADVVDYGSAGDAGDDDAVRHAKLRRVPDAKGKAMENDATVRATKTRM